MNNRPKPNSTFCDYWQSLLAGGVIWAILGFLIMLIGDIPSGVFFLVSSLFPLGAACVMYFTWQSQQPISGRIVYTYYEAAAFSNGGVPTNLTVEQMLKGDHPQATNVQARYWFYVAPANNESNRWFQVTPKVFMQHSVGSDYSTNNPEAKQVEKN